MYKGYPGRRRLGRGGTVAVVAVAVSLGAFGLHRGFAAEAETSRVTGAAALPPLAEKTAPLASLESGFTAIADRLEPSVVSIRVEKRVQMPGLGGGDIERLFQFPGMDDNDDNGAPQTPRTNRPRVFTFPRGGQSMPRTFNQRGSGSGVIVRPDGWILTNDHVVGDADKVTVTLHDGRKFTGTVRRDYRSDLALVKIPVSSLQPAEFADSDRVKVGQWAIAFGSPFQLDDTMTVGIISARQRQKEIVEDGQGRFYPSLLQTDASINPGNSGGALVDINGRVVGINVAINTTTGGSVGIGFAIPSNIARNVMEQLITKGKVTRGFLGIKPSSLSPDVRGTYGVKEGGALVEQVTEGTPAAKAGFQVEDVIMQYNGKPVTDEVSFRDMVATTAPGTKVDVTVRRDGKAVTLTPTIGTVPDELAGAAPAEPVKPAAPKVEKTNAKLGVTVSPVTKELQAQFKLSDNSQGVVITAVEAGSAASEAGLQPGMVILRVDGRRINTSADLTAAVSGAKSGDQVRVVVQAATSTGHTTALIPVTLQ